MGSKKRKSKATSRVLVGPGSEALEEALRNAVLQARIDLSTGRPSKFTDLYRRLSGQYDTELQRLYGLIPSESDILGRNVPDTLIGQLMGRGAISSSVGGEAVARLADVASNRRAAVLPALSSQALRNLTALNPEVGTGQYLAGVSPDVLATYAPRQVKSVSKAPGGGFGGAISGALQGGLGGFMVGGPLGAAIGAGAGGLGGAFGGQGGLGNLSGLGSLLALRQAGLLGQQQTIGGQAGFGTSLGGGRSILSNPQYKPFKLLGQ